MKYKSKYQILKNKFRFIPIHFLILFIIGCGDKPKEIVFQDTNNTPNVKITLQSPSGKILETANSNSQGAVKFVGVFEEGTKLKYKIEARLKKPIMEWHRSSWWPNKYEIIIGENKSYEIDYSTASGFKSSRKIKILSIDDKYLKTYDYKTGENRTFRKDRVLNSQEVQ